MNKIDPILAVKDVNASAAWYCNIFNCHRAHGGDEFAVLKDENDQVLLCLHQWAAHGYLSMQDPDIIPGNGLIIYFKTHAPEQIRKKIIELGYPITEEMHLNQNSQKMEFSLRDPDGYYLTVTEYHEYEG